MTEYTLPEGMAADVLRDLADDPVADKVHAALHAWADAIDPPPSTVTDEMVEAFVQAARWRPGHWGDGQKAREILEVVERLGWLRDPNGIDREASCRKKNVELWQRIRRLESAADNPSPSDEPWPTDEQVEAAAKVIAGEVTEWDDLHPDNRESLRVRARIALEAVAPPPTDTLHRALMSELRDRGADPDLTWDEAIGIMAERLEMAEGLLRLATLGVEDRSDAGYWWRRAAEGPVTVYEAEYLRSLVGGDKPTRLGMGRFLAAGEGE